jgi:hypothetical protein
MDTASRPSSLLDGRQNQSGFLSFELATSASARLGTANPCVIDFDLPPQWLPLYSPSTAETCGASSMLFRNYPVAVAAAAAALKAPLVGGH